MKTDTTNKPILVIASGNEKKRREIEELLSGTDCRVLTLQHFPGCPEVEETGETFAENAALKAEAVAAYTGLLTLADDSGLVVDALGESSGVRSARFAAGDSGGNASDEDNNSLLLEKLQGVPDEKRTARFACAMALAKPSGEDTAEVVAATYGTVEGVIAHEPQGDYGFGYDPLFIIPDHGKTFGELGAEVKHSISHRARALALMKENLLRELKS